MKLTILIEGFVLVLQSLYVGHLLRYLCNRFRCLHLRCDVVFLVKMDVVAPNWKTKRVKKGERLLTFRDTAGCRDSPQCVEERSYLLAVVTYY